MKKEFAATSLDVAAFAHDGATLQGREYLRNHTRLLAETQGQGGELQVQWSARGEERAGRSGRPQVWVHLDAKAVLPLTCQRCLGPVQMPLTVERSFRFVADEDTAMAEDDEAEEDLLVISRSFDLLELVEDELLMEMPAVPRHKACPTDLKLAVADAEFESVQEDRPNPFAVLQGLKSNKGN